MRFISLSFPCKKSCSERTCAYTGNSLYNENGHNDRYLYMVQTCCFNMFIARLLISLSPHCHTVGNCVSFFFRCKIFEIVKVKWGTLLTELSFQHAPCMSRFTSLGLFTWHFCIRMYCVPTATLNQKKQSQLLYLGDVQIISFT